MQARVGGGGKANDDAAEQIQVRGDCWESNGMPNKHAAMLGKLLRSMDALCTNAWRTGPCSDTKSSSNRPAASFAMILKTSSSIGWVATATTIACCAAS
jgi:hypothetical protein